MAIREIEINVSGGRVLDSKVMPNGICNLSVEVGAPSIILPNNIAPKKKKVYSEELECRIDPSTFTDGVDWARSRSYDNLANRVIELKKLFFQAGGETIPSFTCMIIDPSIDPVTGELVYQKGLPPAVGKSYAWWEDAAKSYAPERNSRLATDVQYACKIIELARRMITEFEEDSYWVWDLINCKSQSIACFIESRKNNRIDFEPTGSREVLGFYDLGNTYKILKRKTTKGTIASGCYKSSGIIEALGCIQYSEQFLYGTLDNGVGMVVMD